MKRNWRLFGESKDSSKPKTLSIGNELSIHKRLNLRYGLKCWKARFVLLLDLQVVEERSSVRVNSTLKYFDKTNNNLVVKSALLDKLATKRIYFSEKNDKIWQDQ